MFRTRKSLRESGDFSEGFVVIDFGNELGVVSVADYLGNGKIKSGAKKKIINVKKVMKIHDFVSKPS